MKKLADGDLGTRLVDGACIFLNRPGFPAGPGLRPAQGGRGPGPQPRRVQARGVLAAPPPPGGRDGTRRAGHLGRPPVGPEPLGRGRRGVRTGGAPRTRRRSSATSPVYVSMRTELETMAGKKVYKRLGRLPRRADVRPGRRRPSCPTPPSAAEPPAPAPSDAVPARPHSASGSSSAKELGLRRRAEDLVVVVLGGQAPRCVLIVRLRAALRAAPVGRRDRPLQAPRFFEAAMASLLHGNNSLPHQRWHVTRALCAGVTTDHQ